MRIFYKCLTAVLLALVTGFTASAIKVNIDHPEAVTVQIYNYSNNKEIVLHDLNSGENDLPYDYDGMIKVKALSPWVIDSAVGPNGDMDEMQFGINKGLRYSDFSANSDATYTITTHNPEAPQVNNINIDIDNPEAVVVEILEYAADGSSSWKQVQLTEMLTTIPWEEQYGQVRAKAADGWEIVSFEGYTSFTEDTWYNSYPGDDVNWTIRTQQVSSEPTYLTLTLNNPGSVQIFGYYQDEESTMIEPNFVDGQCKIETTMPGVLMMSPNTGWNIVSADGFMDNGAGGLGLMFEPGDTNTYAIVTEESQSTFITLTVENPSSVNVEVMRDEFTPPVPVAAQGNEYKIDTANAGTIYVKAIEPWIISSIDGVDGAPAMTKQENGAYSLDFTAGATSKYNVSTLQPSYVTIDIDNPEAITAKLTYDYTNYDTLELVAGENRFPVTSWGSVQITPKSPWVIDTYEGANLQDGIYYVNVDPQSNKSCKFTTSKPVEPTYITLNVDHPEAITVNVDYGDPNPVVLTPETDGTCKVETTRGGTMQITANSPWSIVTAEGFSSVLGRYILDFTAGAENTYSITTRNSESGGSTNITVNVDHPEAVTVEVLYSGESERTVVEPEGNVYTIDTTTTNGWIYVIPVDPWNITDFGGLTQHFRYPEQGYTSFSVGATNTYNITTDYTDAPAKTYITLNVDNPEALTMVMVEYDNEDMDSLTPTIVQGDNKFETTYDGRLIIIPNSAEWDITSYEGLHYTEEFGGTYGTIFAAGDETVFTITSVKKSEATHLTLDIDNIDGVTVQVAYTDGDATEIELQQGGTEIDTTKGGDILITAKQNWVISSAIGFSEFPGANNKYMMHFEAGDTETYTINVTSVSASVDSILGDEVIETAVFNLQGIKVADSTDNLAAGMYIIAGKKVVVK